MVERGQLSGLGLGKGAIDYRVKLRRLVPFHWGVYSVGHGDVSKEGHWMAAVLAGGAGTVLSHRSAAELWGLRDGLTIPVDVTVDGSRGRRKGIRFMIDDLLNRFATVTKSELEELFIEFLDEFGLPRPEVNQTVEVGGRSFEPDCLWRDARLVIELDGRQFHATRTAFEADRERDRLLMLAGWSTVRVTHWMLMSDCPALAGDLRQLLSYG
jgi:hypothetical protein